MDMYVAQVYIDHPLWYRWSLLLTVLFLFVGVPIARRSRHAILVCALPVLWNLVPTWLGLWRVSHALSLSGTGHRAAAAAVAEAQIPLMVGSFVTAIVSALSGFALRNSRDPSAWNAAELAALAFGGALAVAGVFFGFQIVDNARFSPKFVAAGAFGAGTAALLFAVSCVFLAVSFTAPKRTSGTGPFWGLALAALVGFFGLWRFAHFMWHVAAQP